MLTAVVSQTNLIYLQAINAIKTSHNYYHLYLSPDELVAVRDHAILLNEVCTDDYISIQNDLKEHACERVGEAIRFFLVF